MAPLERARERSRLRELPLTEDDDGDSPMVQAAKARVRALKKGIEDRTTGLHLDLVEVLGDLVEAETREEADKGPGACKVVVACLSLGLSECLIWVFVLSNFFRLQMLSGHLISNTTLTFPSAYGCQLPLVIRFALLDGLGQVWVCHRAWVLTPRRQNGMSGCDCGDALRMVI